ncbi:MAG: hypothetical protein CL781_04335 [Chloroflexi bacterium]|nr:hypothetical protein [Chloroflexota bacterium]|tara:strand:- start:4024 stop:4317 length:294 start_codon:yes stop_codon:yes gene_type:complete
MDPSYISTEYWAEIKIFTSNMGLFVLCIIIFAANMLVGHNMIPSLIASHHVPRTWNKLRPPIYAIAIIAFVAAIYFVITAFVGGLDAIRHIYPDYWI